MEVVFFGSGAFGVPTLEALVTRHRVVGAVTRPDRPAGRGGHMTPTPVARWLAERCPHVPVLKPRSVNAPDVVERIRAWPADAWVVVAYGEKLSPELVRDRFVINLHASLLPRWRGAAPVAAAILAGDAEIGNTVIAVTDRVDAGPILAQSRHPLERSATAGEVSERLARDGARLVLQVLDEHGTGTLRPRVQDESQATRAPRLSRADARLDLTRSAEECRNRIHALTPWPGVAVQIGPERVKVWRAAALESAGHTPDVGAIVEPERGIIACGQGRLQLLEVQPAGGRRMTWAEFVRGRTIRRGQSVVPAGGGA